MPTERLDLCLVSCKGGIVRCRDRLLKMTVADVMIFLDDLVLADLSLLADND